VKGKREEREGDGGKEWRVEGQTKKGGRKGGREGGREEGHTV